MNNKDTKVMRPLVMIDIDGEVRRMEMRKHDPENPILIKIECPFRDQNCSIRCAALGLWENKNEPLMGLVCIASEKQLPLGLLDPETTDLDNVNNLKWGSELRKQFANQR